MTNTWLDLGSAAGEAHRAELRRQAARYRQVPRAEPWSRRIRRILGHLHPAGPPFRPGP